MQKKNIQYVTEWGHAVDFLILYGMINSTHCCFTINIDFHWPLANQAIKIELPFPT